MKETPILFSGSMPEAAMSGRKTQTRRKIKNTGLYAIDKEIHGIETAKRELKALASKCPYGKPGDRLRFLGTWAVHKMFDGRRPSSLPHSVLVWSVYSGEPKPDWCGKSRPGRFMPKWMRCQMPLADVTGVRVERLQDISEEDAKAEGVESGIWQRESGVLAGAVDPEDEELLGFRDGFGFLWESIHGIGSWDLNPLVWVIEFRRVKP